MIKKITFLLSCTILFFILSACDNQYAENERVLIQEINHYYNENIHNKEQQVCFYLGNISFPYQSQTISPLHHKKWDVWVNNELNRRLELFSKIGLLKSSKSQSSTHHQINYELTELGNIHFLKGQFCFGQIDIKDISLKIDKKSANTKPTALIKYKINNIPDWAKSEQFIDYFYRHHNKNDYNRYPQLNNQQHDLTLSLIQSKDNFYTLKTQREIFDNLFNYKNIQLKNNVSYFAYYNAGIAKQLIKQSKINNEIMPTWGEPDPIIMAKPQMEPYIARANNLILLASSDIIHLISKNKIKSIDERYDYEIYDAKVHHSYEFDKDGSLNKFVSIYKKQEGSIEKNITKYLSPEDDQLLWIMRESAKRTAPYKLYNVIEQFQVFNFNTIQYQTDLSRQIVTIGPEFNTQQSIVIVPVFNEQNQLIEFAGKQWQYQDDLLIQIIIPENYKVIKLIYGDTQKLIESIYYQQEENQLSIISECYYSDFNELNDWTTSNCDGTIKTRTITYYE